MLYLCNNYPFFSEKQSGCGFLAAGVQSTCRQRYSIHRLASRDPFSPGEGIVQAAFKLPSGCFCYIHHDDRLPTERSSQNHIRNSNRGLSFAQNRQTAQSYRDKIEDISFSGSENQNIYNASPAQMFRNGRNIYLTKEFPSKRFPMIRFDYDANEPKALALKADEPNQLSPKKTVDDHENDYILTLQKVLPDGHQEPVEVLLNVDDNGIPNSSVLELLNKLNKAIERNNNLRNDQSGNTDKFKLKEPIKQSHRISTMINGAENLNFRSEVNAQLPNIVQNYYITLPKSAEKQPDSLSLNPRVPNFAMKDNLLPNESVNTSMNILEDILSHLHGESNNGKFGRSNYRTTNLYQGGTDSRPEKRVTISATRSQIKQTVGENVIKKDVSEYEKFIENHRVEKISTVTTFRPQPREISSETIHHNSFIITKHPDDPKFRTNNIVFDNTILNKGKSQQSVDISSQFSRNNAENDLGGIFVNSQTNGELEEYLPFRYDEKNALSQLGSLPKYIPDVTVHASYETSEIGDYVNNSSKYYSDITNRKTKSLNLENIHENHKVGREDGIISYIHPQEVFELLSEQSKQTQLKAREVAQINQGLDQKSVGSKPKHLPDNLQKPDYFKEYRKFISLSNTDSSRNLPPMNVDKLVKISQITDVSAAGVMNDHRLTQEHVEQVKNNEYNYLTEKSRNTMVLPNFSFDNSEKETDWVPIKNPNYSVQTDGTQIKQEKLKKPTKIIKSNDNINSIITKNNDKKISIDEYIKLLENHKLRTSDQGIISDMSKNPSNEFPLPPKNYDALSKQELLKELKNAQKTDEDNNLLAILERDIELKNQDSIIPNNRNQLSSGHLQQVDMNGPRNTIIALTPQSIITQESFQHHQILFNNNNEQNSKTEPFFSYDSLPKSTTSNLGTSVRFPASQYFESPLITKPNHNNNLNNFFMSDNSFKNILSVKPTSNFSNKTSSNNLNLRSHYSAKSPGNPAFNSQVPQTHFSVNNILEKQNNPQGPSRQLRNLQINQHTEQNPRNSLIQQISRVPVTPNFTQDTAILFPGQNFRFINLPGLEDYPQQDLHRGHIQVLQPQPQKTEKSRNINEIFSQIQQLNEPFSKNNNVAPEHHLQKVPQFLYKNVNIPNTHTLIGINPINQNKKLNQVKTDLSKIHVHQLQPISIAEVGRPFAKEGSFEAQADSGNSIEIPKPSQQFNSVNGLQVVGQIFDHINETPHSAVPIMIQQHAINKQELPSHLDHSRFPNYFNNHHNLPVLPRSGRRLPTSKADINAQETHFLLPPPLHINPVTQAVHNQQQIQDNDIHAQENRLWNPFSFIG